MSLSIEFAVSVIVKQAIIERDTPDLLQNAFLQNVWVYINAELCKYVTVNFNYEQQL